MRRRIFVAINLPAEIVSFVKETMEEIKSKMTGSVRFIESGNWHFTISFLGYQDENDIAKISAVLKETTQNFKAPPIVLEKIVYGPEEERPRPPKFFDKKLGRARMIWLTTDRETSQRLSQIKNFLEKKLIEIGINLRMENRLFNAHLTLARFPTVARSSLPAIERGIIRRFEGPSLDLTESHLKRSGAEYEKLAEFPFSG